MNSQTLERSFFHRLFVSTLSVLAMLVTSHVTAGCGSQSRQSNAAVEAAQKNTPNKPNNTNTQVLRVGFISTESKVPIGPEGWAMRSGKLKRELQNIGVSDVKFFPFGGGPALNEALSSESLDIGMYGDTPAIVAKAAGINTKLINQTRVGQNAWLIVKKQGVNSLADLKGQKVAVAKGTYPHRYLLGLLDKAGLSKDVKLVQIASADVVPALTKGDIAAYPFAMGAGPLLVTKGWKSIDEAKNHKGLVGTGVTVVTNKILAKHPQLPQKWNQMRQKALQEIQANPEAFYKFAAEASGDMPLPVVKESYPLNLYPQEPFTPDGLELLNSTKKFLADQNLLKSDFNVKDWMLTDTKS
jgi:NitT/TauT family transport system substrate-binding protein/sulfonate transport system substrate-binding protein